MHSKASALALASSLLFAVPLLAQRPAKVVPEGLEERVKKFFADKEEQGRALAGLEGQEQVPEIWEFFEAGQNGDWQTVTDLYRQLSRGAYQYEGSKKDPRLATVVWQPVNEAYGAYDQCSGMAEEYATLFGRDILASMPRGGIYFGGTDPGRWLPTAFCKSHANADPVFVLTQNALADGLYLKYLREMYGKHIVTPSDDDSKQAFEDYKAEAVQREKEGKLKPGENITKVNGNYQVSGQVAVMGVNARIARKIFDANSDREFFIEESFPLDWMYPHLSPHGLILKLNRKVPAELPPDGVRKDHEFWTRFTDKTLGNWLKEETKVDKICEFATTVYLDKELGEFKGDRAFVENAAACKTYSKLRSSIGGVYAWRAKNSASAEERKRMVKEADLAFRQAFALCPYSPEAVFRYANLLVDQGRKKDALLLAQTGEQLDPRNRSFGNFIRELEEKQ
jgi:hypothetical protein